MKEELTTDTEGEGSLMGDGGSAEPRGAEVSPLRSDSRQTSPPVDASSNHVHVKEEPQERDLSVLSPFSICRERPSSSANSLDLPGVGVRSSPIGPTAASLFSPDITTKTATDLLMKLSGTCASLPKGQTCHTQVNFFSTYISPYLGIYGAVF